MALRCLPRGADLTASAIQALLSNEPRGATIRAESQLELLYIQREAFEAILGEPSQTHSYGHLTRNLTPTPSHQSYSYLSPLPQHATKQLTT